MATEAAIKLAKTYTGRSSVISFSGGHQSMTHGSLAMTGNLSAKSSQWFNAWVFNSCHIRMNTVAHWALAVKPV